MVPATSIALSLDQQGLWCSHNCTIPNLTVRVHPLLRASQFLPRKDPWQNCLGKFVEPSQWLTTGWVQESVLPDVTQWLRKECYGKETREPCTVSRHTVCTHKSNRALQRALGNLESNLQTTLLAPGKTFCHSPNSREHRLSPKSNLTPPTPFYKRRANASPQQGAGTTPPLLFSQIFLHGEQRVAPYWGLPGARLDRGGVGVKRIKRGQRMRCPYLSFVH